MRRARVYRKQSRLRSMGLRRNLPSFRRGGHYGKGRNWRTGGFLGQELKFYDTKLVDGALTAPSDASGGEHDPSATIVLNSVVQGDGEQQRDGRKMTMKSLYINGLVIVAAQAGQTAGENGSTCFIAVVIDTQTNGATIISEQVYKNVMANARGAAAPMRNLEFSTRYRILGTKVLSLNNPNQVNDTGSTGGFVAMTTSCFVFTSNVDPMDWYMGMGGLRRSPLHRRFREFATIVEFN